MGLKVKEAGAFVDVGGGTTTTQLVDEWVRNPAWPAIPTVLASEQKIVGLYAVWPGDGVGNGANFFAFNGQGAYTINFGDGTTTNYASNTQANYEFNFNNSALAGTNKPVTFTEGRRYYVVNPTANAFQVSATFGGAPVTLTNDGSATLLPYKIAIVTITPQAGQNLTVINLQAKHNQTGLQAYTTGWLDFAISVPNVTGVNYTLGGTAVGHRLLERVNVVACGVLTNMANMYSNTPSLRSVSAFPSGISEVTTMASHYLNSGLKNFPVFLGSAAKVQSTSQMFNNCFNAEYFPALPGSIAALTNVSNMYASTSVKRIPAFPSSTANISNFTNICQVMPNLVELPAFNLNGVTSAGNGANMFINCPSVRRIPISNMRFSFSVANCQLSAAATNEIFEGLPTVATAQTITVSGNPNAGFTASIATAKNWVVVA